jgi:hypothetical protein
MTDIKIKDNPPVSRAVAIDRAIIVLFALIGLVGSVVLFTLEFSPILVSVFLGLGVAAVVYGFLGGIGQAEFKIGPAKLGGTLAALLAVAYFVNGYLATQTLAITSSVGRYIWEYAPAGWAGYIEVHKDKTATIQMVRYLDCSGVIKTVPLLTADGVGRVVESLNQSELHVSIPVRFANYDANCNRLPDNSRTVLEGTLTRSTGFTGSVKYENSYGAPLGGMNLLKADTY